mmetsp:Transcript_13723/g.35019  ORF Transcript_13723/g.35019 Transcript_13723/m.35019 type:complete len:264 (+) Transcript_13723:571-1362(+)
MMASSPPSLMMASAIVSGPVKNVLMAPTAAKDTTALELSSRDMTVGMALGVNAAFSFRDAGIARLRRKPRLRCCRRASLELIMSRRSSKMPSCAAISFTCSSLRPRLLSSMTAMTAVSKSARFATRTEWNFFQLTKSDVISESSTDRCARIFREKRCIGASLCVVAPSMIVGRSDQKLAFSWSAKAASMWQDARMSGRSSASQAVGNDRSARRWMALALARRFATALPATAAMPTRHVSAFSRCFLGAALSSAMSDRLATTSP